MFYFSIQSACGKCEKLHPLLGELRADGFMVGSCSDSFGSAPLCK